MRDASTAPTPPGTGPATPDTARPAVTTPRPAEATRARTAVPAQPPGPQTGLRAGPHPGAERPGPPPTPRTPSSAPPPGEPAGEPATATERRFWALQHTAGHPAAALTFGRFRLTGPVDLPALAVALRAVRERHEGLRTAYTVRGGTLLAQVVDRPVEHEPLVLPSGTAPGDALRLLRAGPAPDATRADLLRWAVVPLPDGADLYLAVHHIAFDGASGEVLAADLAHAYAQALAGERPRPAPAPRHRAQPLAPARRTEHEAYWQHALAGLAELPDDGRGLTRRELLRDMLVQRSVRLGAAEAATLRERARSVAATSFAVLLAAYARALSALAGVRDFAVGTAVADRRAGTEQEVGCLFTMVPVPVRDPLAPDCVPRLWQAVVDCVLHAGLPLENIVRAAGAGRGRRMPLYQATFLLQNWPRHAHHAGPVTVRTVPVPPSAPQAEVLLELYDDGHGPVHGVLQAPSRSVWADRLTSLADRWHQEALLTAAGSGTCAPRPGP
ncbi:condensation domain-containing protein [Streptomyces coeruleorubidus]|uniref:condensation domain-containing protein n=1 Tax=Streptomyces coeruleorubidus TaxID=116188 RepID=UPI0036A75D80